MFHDTLTNEDAAIFQRAASRNREYLPADYMVMMGDSTDYRAMLTLATRRGCAPGTYAAWRNWALLTFSGVALDNDHH